MLDFKIQNCPQNIRMNELLTPTSVVFGNLYVPLAFKLYKTFESASNEKFEITLAYGKYRASLSQTL